MKTHTIKSTKDLIKFLPELKGRSQYKYKKVVDHFFSIGLELTLKEQDFCTFFTSGSGKQYKYLVENSEGKGFYLGMIKVEDTLSTLEDINSGVNLVLEVSIEPVGGLNGVPTYETRTVFVKETYWARLGRIIGNLIDPKVLSVEKEVKIASCPTCNGQGIRKQFLYYADGICFCCGGIGKWYYVEGENPYANLKPNY